MTRAAAAAIVFALSLGTTAGHAQRVTGGTFDPRRGQGWKSPTAARVIGILPGAGHVYAGEPRRGLAYFGGTVGVLAIGSVLIAADCVGDVANSTESTCSSPALENGLLAVFLGVWGWSIYDAGRAANRTNARRAVRTVLFVAPARVPAAGRNDARGLYAGLRLAPQ